MENVESKLRMNYCKAFGLSTAVVAVTFLFWAEHTLTSYLLAFTVLLPLTLHILDMFEYG
jgi:hypothetical protein